MLSEWLSYCERGEILEQMPVTSDNLRSRLDTDAVCVRLVARRGVGGWVKRRYLEEAVSKRWADR